MPFTLPEHHAVLIRAQFSLVDTKLRELLSVHSWGSDPDVILLPLGDMKVEDARALQGRASQAPLSRKVTTFVLALEGLTRETQNALLKLFEDPPHTARFIVVLPRSVFVLPTLLSRFLVIHAAREGDDTMPEFSPIDSINTLGERLKKTPEVASAISASLQKKRHGTPATLRAVALMERFIQSKGASHKMLFEHALLSHFESIAKKSPDR